jgi:hypothetical protein
MLSGVDGPSMNDRLEGQSPSWIVYVVKGCFFFI